MRALGHRAAAFLVILVAGCTETRYVEYAAVKESGGLPYRTVAFEIDRAFYEDFPECAVVVPAKRSSGTRSAKNWATLVEDALSRQLRSKVGRIVDPSERDAAARRLALEPALADDQRRLARALGCDALAIVEPIETGAHYMVFWAEVRVGFEVRLVRAEDGRLLWRARHATSRTEGGLPMSPFALVSDTVASTRFSIDGEIPASVVEDAARRIVAVLPDIRNYR